MANLKRLDSLDAGSGAGRDVCSGRDGWDSWAWQIMKRTRAREQSVHAHSMDRIAKSKPLLTRKNTTSMYVAMLISVTKASMYFNSVEIDGAARTNQVGYITVIARLLGIYGNVNRLLVLGLRPRTRVGLLP